MEVGMILAAVGAIAFIGYFIWLIIRIKNWDSKIPPIIGMLLCLVMIVGGASTMPELDKTNSGGGKPVQSADDQSSENDLSSKEDETEEDTSSFSVGDPVNLNDIIVTLVNVRESNGSNFMTPEDGKVFILCEFEIENNSKKDINVSSVLSFEAYVDDYATSMDLSAVISSGKTQLDGTVASGKKMNGEIGYQASKDWSNIEIRFSPDFWGKNITFTYKK